MAYKDGAFRVDEVVFHFFLSWMGWMGEPESHVEIRHLMKEIGYEDCKCCSGRCDHASEFSGHVFFLARYSKSQDCIRMQLGSSL